MKTRNITTATFLVLTAGQWVWFSLGGLLLDHLFTYVNLWVCIIPTLYWCFHLSTTINTRVSQKFCNILVTSLLYSSSYKKNRLAFKGEDIVFEATFLPILRSQTDTSSCPLKWRTLKGSQSGLYDGWGYLLTYCLIPCWDQFLFFEVKNSFTEASTSSWLLKRHVSWKWTMDWNK